MRSTCVAGSLDAGSGLAQGSTQRRMVLRSRDDPPVFGEPEANLTPRRSLKGDEGGICVGHGPTLFDLRYFRNFSLAYQEPLQVIHRRSLELI